jgi:glyoxylase-like metal-dependent hydrolase (beta-lactamase superfamily II)
MKIGLLLLTGCLVVQLAGCSANDMGPAAGRALVDVSAAAMGGWPAMDAVKVQEIVTTGSDWEPLQSLAPGGDPRQMNTFTQTTLADYEKQRLRITFDATRVYPAPGPVKFTEVISGDVGMLQSSDNGKITADRLHPSRRVTRMRDFNRLPLRLLYAAKNASDIRRDEDKPGGKLRLQILKYTDAGLQVELQIDKFNQLPTRVIYKEDDPVEGDSVNEVVFDEWKEPVNGVRTPQRMTTFVNGKKLREETIKTLAANPKFDEASFNIPLDVRAQPENGAPIVSQWVLRRVINGVTYADFGREQKVEFVPVAPGVFQITGTSHNSMVVEMKDGLLVVEMPLYEERSLAVLHALEEKFPGKPVKYGVITHYHMDHSGGVRAYAAKGVTLYAHDSIVPWVREMLARPKTIRPDSLAKAGNVKDSVEGVTDTKTITDGERTVELRSIPSGHAAGMLVAYLPKEKVLFVSDLYSPGTPVAQGDQMTNAFAFYKSLDAAKISVDRIVGGHGGIGSYKDFTKIVAPAVREKVYKLSDFQ